MPNYKRAISELRENAVLWWPESLKQKNSDASVTPKLLDSQERFISILNLCDASPTQIFELVETAGFPANLFLKHLSVITDYGGEPIQRLGRSFTEIFTETTPTGRPVMEYVWNDETYHYEFEALPVKGLGNARLKTDGPGLQNPTKMDGLARDMIMLFLYGSTSDGAEHANLEICNLGTLLGKPKDIEEYVRQRYIIVSRITGGASANTLGQLAQTYIVDYLKEDLGAGFSVVRNGKIIIDGYAKDGGMPFDVVISNGNGKIGVEVSFQVTTNSTIERKAGQSQGRLELMAQAGHKLAYVLDGAGNFQRAAAIATICANSDCTVAYSDSEFALLANFAREVLG
jgi:hypothetical protein